MYPRLKLTRFTVLLVLKKIKAKLLVRPPSLLLYSLYKVNVLIKRIAKVHMIENEN